MIFDLSPTLVPLGDRALVVRYSETLSEIANCAAIAAARHLDRNRPEGVEEVVAGLVSVLLRTSPQADFGRLRGEIGLLLDEVRQDDTPSQHTHRIPIIFDGDDLVEVASALSMTADSFIDEHNALPLRVLATGFAPGFVYCGFHPANLIVPRRTVVRPKVPAGTVLFAAGQTAIAATPIRTGWHVIGRTTFQNFDPEINPPTRLAPGDGILFEPLS